MITISQASERIVKGKPFLEEALADELINLSSLARQIKPDIESILGKEIKLGAIVMALKRYQPLLDLKVNFKFRQAIKNLGDITVRSNLTDYTFQNSDTLVNKQTILLKIISKRKEIFYTFSQGVYESTLVLSDIISDEVDRIFVDEKLINKKTSLSSITIKLPKENNKLPGLYYYFFKKIAWDGINISEVISTTNEFSIVVEDKDVDNAFSILKNL